MKKKKERGVMPTFKELMADMKPMTFWEKVDHLWTYYKEYLVIAFVAILVLTMTISSYINANKEYLIRGMMVNLTITQEGYNYLTEDYQEKFEGDKIVEMDHASFADLADPTSSEDNLYASQKLQARVSGGLLDYALVDQMSFEFYMRQAVYGDMTTIFTPEELEAMGDKVITTMEEGDEPMAVAIDISESAFVQDAIGKDVKVYFIISGNQPNVEACQSIWKHIQDWENR